jgi:Domain of unknown function (DUF6429)
MEYDKDKVDEMVLALLRLTMFEKRSGSRAWKGHDWDVLDRLPQKAYISDPRSKAKSVAVTEKGAKRSGFSFFLDNRVGLNYQGHNGRDTISQSGEGYDDDLSHETGRLTENPRITLALAGAPCLCTPLGHLGI